MEPRISIVVVNYNLEEETADCVESLIRCGADFDHLVVVDNGSPRSPVDYLTKRIGPNLKIISNERALGYASGLNYGIRYFWTQDVDWFLLTSNDVIFAQDFLDELTGAIERFPENKVIGPLILYFGDPDRIWQMGEYKIPIFPFTYSRYHDKKAPDHFPPKIDVDFISGCTMLIHRSVFEQVGLFDTSLFMYGEEVDFFFRVRRSGIYLASIPYARMWHKVGKTMGKEKPFVRYLRIRNQIWIYRRYSAVWQLPAVWLFTVLKSAGLVVRCVLSRESGFLSSIARGWWDGWTSKDAKTHHIKMSSEAGL